MDTLHIVVVVIVIVNVAVTVTVNVVVVIIVISKHGLSHRIVCIDGHVCCRSGARTRRDATYGRRLDLTATALRVVVTRVVVTRGHGASSR